MRNVANNTDTAVCAYENCTNSHSVFRVVKGGNYLDLIENISPQKRSNAVSQGDFGFRVVMPSN